MVRSRGKSRSRTPATPTPISIPTPPAESSVRKKFSVLHHRDAKTLAASSITVTSSIGSPSLNQTHSQGEKFSGWNPASNSGMARVAARSQFSVFGSVASKRLPSANWRTENKGISVGNVADHAVDEYRRVLPAWSRPSLSDLCLKILWTASDHSESPR